MRVWRAGSAVVQKISGKRLAKMASVIALSMRRATMDWLKIYGAGYLETLTCKRLKLKTA